MPTEAFTEQAFEELINRFTAANGGYQAQLILGRDAFQKLAAATQDNLVVNVAPIQTEGGMVGRYLGVPLYVNDQIDGDAVMALPRNQDTPIRMIYEGNNYAVQNPFDTAGDRINEPNRNHRTIADDLLEGITVPRDMVVTEARVDQVNDEVVARLNDGNEIRVPMDRLIEDGWGNTYEWVDGIRYQAGGYVDRPTARERLNTDFDHQEYLREIDAYERLIGKPKKEVEEEEEAPEIKDEDFFNVLLSA